MNLKEAVKTCVCDKYLDFSTRATRKEFGILYHNLHSRYLVWWFFPTISANGRNSRCYILASHGSNMGRWRQKTA